MHLSCLPLSARLGLLFASTALTVISASPSGAVAGETSVGEVFYGIGGEIDIAYSVNSTGSLTIDGGSTRISPAIYVGSSTGSDGTITVTGTGSQLSISDLWLGDLGTGKLYVEDGAHVSISNEAYIGNGSSGVGTITVTGDGSTLETNYFYIGYGGTGTLLIEDGADVTAFYTLIGYGATGTGTVTVSGYGSSLTINGGLQIGADGTGTLTVENEAQVVAGTTYIGLQNSGQATVTGDGTSLSASELYVGQDATGTLTISNGADVTSNSNTSIGDTTSGDGTVTVTGDGSTLTSSSSLIVGAYGSGHLIVEDGADVTQRTTYIGRWSGSDGTVTVTGDGSSLTSRYLYLGYDGSGTLTVADGATVDMDSSGPRTLDIAYFSGTTGTLNIGAAAGETADAAGTINAATIAFGSGTGTLVFNHTDTDYDFDAGINGTGTIEVYSGYTSLNGSLYYFSGAAEIYGGTLSINNTMSSSGAINIYDGGTLGGTGTVTNVTLYDGATIAPGNSIGTLTVSDDLTFVEGTTYAVEVDDEGNADKIVASGAITIEDGSTLSITAENGTDDGSTYTADTLYTILRAYGGITGTFSSVTEDFAYLSASLIYDDNYVYLTLDQSTSDFSSAVTAPNQVAVADAIETLDSSNELYDAVVGLPTGEVEEAYASLSGESLTTADQLQLSRSILSRDTLSNRIRTAGDNGTVVTSSLTAYGEDGINAILAAPEKTEAWISGFGSWTRTDGTADVGGASANGGGLLFGLDRAFGDGWRLGAMGGYGQDSVSSTETDASSTVDSYYLGLYGSRDLGPLSMRFGAIHAFQETDSKRTVSFTGFDEQLSADYNGSTSQAFVEGAWRINRDLVHLEPFVGLAYTRVRTDAFSETGGSAALSREAASDGQLVSSLGVRADRDIAWEGMLGKVSAGLAWQHAFGDLTTESTYAFSGSSSFTVTSAPSDRDSATVNLGVSLDLTEATTVSLDYAGHFGHDTIDNTASGKLRVKF